MGVALGTGERVAHGTPSDMRSSGAHGVGGVQAWGAVR
jgi:hypothetical protein